MAAADEDFRSLWEDEDFKAIVEIQPNKPECI